MITSRRQFLKSAALGFTATGMQPASLVAQADTAPPQESKVASVRNLGNQFLSNSVGVTGADGATSLVLPTGESLWVFGDTVEGPFETIRGLDLRADVG